MSTDWKKRHGLSTNRNVKLEVLDYESGKWRDIYDANGKKHPDGCHPEEEIDILISTDVLAEGLNLQDSVKLINFDIHWNPVKLMQRIGRIDRRLNSDIEKQIMKSNAHDISK